MSAHSIQSKYSYTRALKLFISIATVVVSITLPFTAHAGVITAVVTSAPATVNISNQDKTKCGSITVDSSGHYGTGMVIGLTQLTTTPAKVTTTDTSKDTGCVIVEWDSSAPAASFVVFDEKKKEPIQIDLNNPTFGYTYATAQDNSGTSHHKAILYGLKYGVAYTYRTVTRAHPTAMPRIDDAQTIILNKETPVIKSAKPTNSVVGHINNTNKTVSASSDTNPSTFLSENVRISPNGNVVEPPTTAPDATLINDVPSVAAAAKSIDSVTKDTHFIQKMRTFFRNLYSNIGDSKENSDESPLSTKKVLGYALLLIVIGGIALTFKGDKPQIPNLKSLNVKSLIEKVRALFTKLYSARKNSKNYILIIIAVFILFSSVFMWYYITLLSIAGFLAILAWILIDSIPLEEDDHTSGSVAIPLPPEKASTNIENFDNNNAKKSDQ